MKYRINLPAINITGLRRPPEELAKLAVEKLLPGLGAHLVPHMEPPGPARRAVSLTEVDKTGRVPSHASTAEYPAVPLREVQAATLARSVAPSLVAAYAKAIAAKYAALDAAQARAKAAAEARERKVATAVKALEALDKRLAAELAEPPPSGT